MVASDRREVFLPTENIFLAWPYSHDTQSIHSTAQTPYICIDIELYYVIVTSSWSHWNVKLLSIIKIYRGVLKWSVSQPVQQSYKKGGYFYRNSYSELSW